MRWCISCATLRTRCTPTTTRRQFIVEEAPLRNARLTLVLAVQQVIRNGLGILGVSAPETM